MTDRSRLVDAMTDALYYAHTGRMKSDVAATTPKAEWSPADHVVPYWTTEQLADALEMRARWYGGFPCKIYCTTAALLRQADLRIAEAESEIKDLCNELAEMAHE